MPLPKERIYTIDDIYALPEGERAELIDGQIYYMAPPSRKHQESKGILGGCARLQERRVLHRRQRIADAHVRSGQQGLYARSCTFGKAVVQAGYRQVALPGARLRPPF